MSHHFDDIQEDTRVVIWLKADDSGVLCPDIGVENKYLVHSDGRTAVRMVLIGDQVVVLPLPRQPANSSNSKINVAAGQQQTAAAPRGSRTTAEEVQLREATGNPSLRGLADQQVSVAQAQVVAGGQLVTGGQQPTVSQELSSRVGSREEQQHQLQLEILC